MSASEGIAGWRQRFGPGFAIGERSQSERREDVEAGRPPYSWVAFDGFGHRGRGFTPGAAVADLEAARLAADLERGLLEHSQNPLGLVGTLEVIGLLALLTVFVVSFLVLMLPALFVR